jgi:hypothetical protein
MSHRPGGEDPISKFLKGLNKQGSAIARGGPVVGLAFLVLLVVLLILCLLIFSSDILSFDTNLLEKVQNVRLTLNPYTPTPTVTPTKKPTHTLTPTGNSRVHQQAINTNTEATVTATPTKPTVPLRR